MDAPAAGVEARAYGTVLLKEVSVEMKPKLTARLIVRTILILALISLAFWMVFQKPGDQPLLMAAVWFFFGVFLIEAALPLIRAAVASEKADFLLAAVQYAVIPALALLMLVGAAASLFFVGKLDIGTAVEAGITAVALCVSVGGSAGRAWRRYRQERSRTRQERLAELDSAYRGGAISRAAYLDQKETVYESMWKAGQKREGPRADGKSGDPWE